MPAARARRCLQHPLQLLLPAYSRALSVYLPVYLLPALLVHRQALLKQPLPILQKLLVGIARCVQPGATAPPSCVITLFASPSSPSA